MKAHGERAPIALEIGRKEREIARKEERSTAKEREIARKEERRKERSAGTSGGKARSPWTKRDLGPSWRR